VDFRSRLPAKMTPQQWVDTTRLTFRIDPDEAPDTQGRLTEALSLPAGDYRLEVLFEGTPAGDLLAALGGGHVLARASGPLPRLTEVRLPMPIPVPHLWVQMSDPPSAAAARRVDITPLAIVAVRERRDVDVHTVEAVSGRQGAYMAYVDENAFAEGGVFWTRGTEEATVLVSPAGAPVVNLIVHQGAAGVVKLRANEQSIDVPLGAGETRVVPITVAGGTPYLTLRVQSTAAFRPSETEHSTDTRLLGAQVRIEVPE
jgi:hypothetical protein